MFPYACNISRKDSVSWSMFILTNIFPIYLMTFLQLEKRGDVCNVPSHTCFCVNELKQMHYSDVYPVFPTCEMHYSDAI